MSVNVNTVEAMMPLARLVSLMIFFTLATLCNSHTRLDPTAQNFTRFIKVMTKTLTLLHLPTTSTTFNERHTNAKVIGVYKYPIHVTVSNQVRIVLSNISDLLITSFIDLFFLKFLYTSVTIQNNGRLGLNILTDLSLGNITLFTSGFNSGTNSVGFLFDAMASSPRSVLDAAFQCEAIPVCLEERSSSSLLQALNRTLAGRLLTTKRPSVSNLTLAVSRLWNCTHRLRVFDHGGPWYVNGDLLLISRMNPNQSIEQLPFSYTKLWVRCYDLPPKCFTKEYAEAIGNSLGRYSDTDLPSEDPDEAKLLVQTIPTVRKYLRVKFDFNLYGPLKSTQSIKICNSKKVVVEEHISRLTYERLPHTCFRCGYIGHLLAGCSFTGPLLYGEWIRAERFFRINLQNPANPNAISTSKEGQSSTSQRQENQPIQVSNVADLVSSMVNDPGIIKASFSHARAAGLPPSKGKAPMMSPPRNNSLVPYTNVSPSKSISPTTVFGPPPDSILGAAPSYMRSHGSPLGGGDSILIENEEGQFASFLNSITSHEGFNSMTSRCLFMDPLTVSPAGSKSLAVSPKPQSNSMVADPPAETQSGMLSNVFKEELRKLPVGRKRAQGNPQTPRPKRGRQTSATDGQA